MKRKDVLTLLIPSLIIVVLWVIFSVYHNFIGSTIPTSVNDQISQINPNFDTKTIEAIKNRNAVNPLYSLSAAATGVQASAPSETTSAPISSSSAQTASQGGVLNQ